MCEAFRKLEAAGADVLGLNCARGPATMLPLMEEIKKCIKVSRNHNKAILSTAILQYILFLNTKQVGHRLSASCT